MPSKNNKRNQRRYYRRSGAGTFKKHKANNPNKHPRFEPPPPVPEHLEGVFDTLIPDLKRACAAAEYDTPTPIQEQAIPHLVEGRDLLGCAQTGTGKTAAFVLPILQYLHTERRRPEKGLPRVLILAPTRELAAQIGDSIAKYGKFVNIKHTVIFGGVGQNPQTKALNSGVDILVATPGRLLDLMQQGYISFKNLEVFVLDEADRMLDMGFLPDIRKVIAKLPQKRQTLFFSATMAPNVVTLARTLVSDPVHITIEPGKPAVEFIEQKVYFVDQPVKIKLLIHLLRDNQLDRVLVFTRMKHRANIIARKLENSGISVIAIHGNKSQNARTKALADFKTGKARVMIATDIAARGIDVDSISHVINFDLPEEPEVYIHRIGRTARAGAEGDAISFCSAEELSDLRSIERLISQSIPKVLGHEYHSENAKAGCGISSSSKNNSKGRRGSGSRRQSPRRSFHHRRRGGR